jgi:phage terminase large subunit-like protein
MTRTTHSPDKRLSPEVRWYLESRRIPIPTCPPQVLTPEPRKVRGARFDPERVDRVLRALRQLRHTQGELAGQPLNPDPWQIAYIIAPVFGWVMPDGKGGWVRIIRRVYIEVPKKNGKSTLVGGLDLYLTAADDEPGAQVYAGATGKDQARFVFDPIKDLCKNSPALKRHLKPLQSRIVHKRSGSYFAVVSRVASLLQGGSVHAASIDELHLHPNGELLDALERGTAARRQPLIIIITTSGDESDETIYAKRHNRILQLAKKTIADPQTFGVIWAADPKDDPFDERTWAKVNPGYGISPTRTYMQSAARDAQQSPSDLANFLRYHLNIRTTLERKGIDLRVWDASGGIVVEEKLRGRVCVAGLDLSTTRDLTAFILVFPPIDDREHGNYDVVSRLWIPEENVDERSRRDGVDYRAWEKEGALRFTPGNAIDFETIEKQILDDARQFAIQRIAFDPKFAWQMGQRLDKAGLPMLQFLQGFQTMGPPWLDLMALIRQRRFNHGGNPVLRQMADVVTVEEDSNGLRKPSKRRSTQRIDGIVAATMAVDLAQRLLFGDDQEEPDEGLLVYDDPVTIGPSF